MDFALFWKRIKRAALLDIHLYEEVEADRETIGQAGLVVVLSGLAAGIGSLSHGGLGGLVGITLASLVSWGVWAYLTYYIGTRLLPEPQTSSDPGELLRAIGFASSPGLIRVFGIVPGLTAVLNLAAGVWMLVAMVIAVRQALDYHSTWRAIGVCLIGWIIQTAILLLAFWIFGLGKPPGAV
ncbi:hypothetical protein DESUT3_17660 [Desulfuromonas versatilis]|uniref:Yip1 domain-containing protein n=1 Tax=Desulfuromonas versatilis TaxID=2802975 RepID=A0ABM8HVI0_9BACT|nr:YIP1 family protein [Desulfuromonas versatilis]BCR04697.1 hypothetical protein DESUT3_17660 [Desulfuromonas versatilis]